MINFFDWISPKFMLLKNALAPTAIRENGLRFGLIFSLAIPVFHPRFAAPDRNAGAPRFWPGSSLEHYRKSD